MCQGWVRFNEHVHTFVGWGDGYGVCGGAGCEWGWVSCGYHDKQPAPAEFTALERTC